MTAAAWLRQPRSAHAEGRRLARRKRCRPPHLRNLSRSNASVARTCAALQADGTPHAAAGSPGRDLDSIIDAQSGTIRERAASHGSPSTALRAPCRAVAGIVVEQRGSPCASAAYGDGRPRVEAVTMACRALRASAGNADHARAAAAERPTLSRVSRTRDASSARRRRPRARAVRSGHPERAARAAAVWLPAGGSRVTRAGD